MLIARRKYTPAPVTLNFTAISLTTCSNMVSLMLAVDSEWAVNTIERGTVCKMRRSPGTTLVNGCDCVEEVNKDRRNEAATWRQTSVLPDKQRGGSRHVSAGTRLHLSPGCLVRHWHPPAAPLFELTPLLCTFGVRVSCHLHCYLHPSFNRHPFPHLHPWRSSGILILC